VVPLKIIQKEKFHVDYYYHSARLVVTRLFWEKYQPQFSKNRQLGAHSYRHCHHPDYFEAIGISVNKRKRKFPIRKVDILQRS
jgi:hypothetical protein